MYAGPGIATSDDVRRPRQLSITASHHAAHSPSSTPSSSPHHTHNRTSHADSASSPSSQLSSLRRLSACTVSLSRKPADAIKPPRTCRHVVTVHNSGDSSASEASEYRLSDESDLSDSSSTSSKEKSCKLSKSRRRAVVQANTVVQAIVINSNVRDNDGPEAFTLSDSYKSSHSSSSSSDSDTSETSETSFDRKHRLHRMRQARYAHKKRIERRRQQLLGQSHSTPNKTTPILASVMTKRRLSSSSHISPAMLPVVKAQLVESLRPRPIPATGIGVMQTVNPEHMHSPVQSPHSCALIMSPLTLGVPASAVTASMPSFLAAASSSFPLSSSSAAIADTPEPFLNVSIDVFHLVLAFLHPMDLLSLSAVSAAAHKSVSDPSIWRPLVHSPWPITCDHSHDWKRVYCTRIKRALAGARYLCTYCACTRTFKQEGLLEAHIATHNTTQPTVYPCTVAGCGLSFATARRLHYHVKRHDGAVKKLHACDWQGCTMIFPTPYALSLHRCRHTGEQRPHACKHAGCSRSFNSRHALALHADTHNARVERPACFRCAVDGCGRVFMTRGGLSKHGVKEHYGTAKVVCGVVGCGRRFYYRSELLKHVRKRHETVEEVDESNVNAAAAAEEEEEEDEKDGGEEEVRMGVPHRVARLRGTKHSKKRKEKGSIVA